MELKEKILEEIRKIEEDDIMQQPTAPIDVNAPLALMQCTLDGQIQALRNDEGYRVYVAHHLIDRGATEGNHSEVIIEEHFDDLISALLYLESVDIKKYLNKVEPCTR